MPTYLYFGENEFFLTRTIKQLQEFPLIPQWQTQALIRQACTLADEVGVTLTTDAYTVLITQAIVIPLGISAIGSSIIN